MQSVALNLLIGTRANFSKQVTTFARTLYPLSLGLAGDRMHRRLSVWTIDITGKQTFWETLHLKLPDFSLDFHLIFELSIILQFFYLCLSESRPIHICLIHPVHGDIPMQWWQHLLGRAENWNQHFHYKPWAWKFGTRPLHSFLHLFMLRCSRPN